MNRYFRPGNFYRLIHGSADYRFEGVKHDRAMNP